MKEFAENQNKYLQIIRFFHTYIIHISLSKNKTHIKKDVCFLKGENVCHGSSSVKICDNNVNTKVKGRVYHEFHATNVFLFVSGKNCLLRYMQEKRIVPTGISYF